MQVVLCAIPLTASIAAAVYLIWRYEYRQIGAPGIVLDEDTWRPYLRTVHPIWLLIYRVIVFIVFTVLAISSDVTLYYYTEWTFVLVTIYFALATLVSTYGCGKFERRRGREDREAAGFQGYLLQIIYQTSAGATILTDGIFWIILFPYLIRHGERPDFWMVVPHTVNAVFLFGDAALNRMSFPWFRIAYFILWTALYVLFQWFLHAATAMNWWPYPFLDLASPWAPLWYILVGVLQIPCYMSFLLAVNLKRRAFPAAFMTGGEATEPFVS